MTDYFVSFNGHLKEGSRPDGWPKIVQDKFVYRSENPAQLVEYLNEKARRIKQDGGMTVEVKEPYPDDDLKSDDQFGNGKFIPLHMIAYISYTVRTTAAPMPDVGDEGVILQ